MFRKQQALFTPTPIMILNVFLSRSYVDLEMCRWEEETMDFARHMQGRGVEMGQRSQFGHHPLAQTMHGMAR